MNEYRPMELPLRYVLTVSELTREIKDILEERFRDIWVEGEISNLRIPPSGHIYFTLKDDFSQIRTVLFKTQARTLRFLPEDGIHIICRGRVSLYEKRGDYQLILESIEPKGMGALQLAFLQLKERLEKEGLFDPARKRRIPAVPQRIGIVTSPTGSVIQDMLNILQRRFENLPILLFPARVQGEEACSEICEAIRYFNQFTDVDVIIVGRGGGSLEDLWAFNEEALARTIYQSKIPIISAVGHETDYTIADFVADLRAPTPSAAAELVVRNKRDMKNILQYLGGRLEKEMVQVLEEYRIHLSHLMKVFREPKRKTEEYILRVDDLLGRLRFLARWSLRRKREKVVHLSEGLDFRNPIEKLKKTRLFVTEKRKHLEKRIAYFLGSERQAVGMLLGKLDSLSPLAILRRGYSITRKLPSREILRNAAQVREGDKVEVKLHQGALLCGIEKAERS
jgi:exodeoxyribonuclease VII large subunit